MAPPEPRPPPGVEIECFRVAQEAFTNAVRHAQARRADVELSDSVDVLERAVRDDGRAFDVVASVRLLIIQHCDVVFLEKRWRISGESGACPLESDGARPVGILSVKCTGISALPARPMSGNVREPFRGGSIDGASRAC